MYSGAKTENIFFYHQFVNHLLMVYYCVAIHKKLIRVFVISGIL